MNSNCKKRSKVTRTAVIPAEKEDRLGDLPDEIICLILSFLPTGDALRTSILSPRWKNVYLGIPDINSAIALERYLLKAPGMIASVEADLREIKDMMKAMKQMYDKIAETMIKYLLLRLLGTQNGEDEGGGESGEEAQDDEDGDANGEIASEETRDDEEDEDGGESEDSGSG